MGIRWKLYSLSYKLYIVNLKKNTVMDVFPRKDLPQEKRAPQLQHHDLVQNAMINFYVMF